MSYEEQMRKHYSKPSEKDIILAKIVRGDKNIDITKDEDIFYQINKDRVSIEQFTNRDKFKADAAQMKEFKQTLLDPAYGRTKTKNARLLGEIPAEIYYARKEFSDPMIPMQERVENMKKFFNTFPVFRAGDKRL